MKHKFGNANYYLGNEIDKIRKARGYTQEGFAEICGISRAYYGRIERGEYNVTVEMCQRIADGFGCHISELFINLPF